MADWRDQVALVTGGGRGIGRAIARRLAREGASVCVNFVSNEDAAEAVVARDHRKRRPGDRRGRRRGR